MTEERKGTLNISAMFRNADFLVFLAFAFLLLCVRFGGRRQAPEALWAVREVVRLGYGVGIATASCHTDYVRTFLAEMAPEIFTQEMLFSNAFQSCQKKKTGALKCNLAHYGLLDKPECSVFFDDSISNEK